MAGHLAHAANGIHEIAEKLRAQALPIRAKVVREALIEAAKDDPDYRVAGHCEALADLASDDTLAKLGRLLK